MRGGQGEGPHSFDTTCCEAGAVAIGPTATSSSDCYWIQHSISVQPGARQPRQERAGSGPAMRPLSTSLNSLKK